MKFFFKDSQEVRNAIRDWDGDRDAKKTVTRLHETQTRPEHPRDWWHRAVAKATPKRP